MQTFRSPSTNSPQALRPQLKPRGWRCPSSRPLTGHYSGPLPSRDTGPCLGHWRSSPRLGRGHHCASPAPSAKLRPAPAWVTEEGPLCGPGQAWFPILLQAPCRPFEFEAILGFPPHERHKGDQNRLTPVPGNLPVGRVIEVCFPGAQAQWIPGNRKTSPPQLRQGDRNTGRVRAWPGGWGFSAGLQPPGRGQLGFSGNPPRSPAPASQAARPPASAVHPLRQHPWLASCYLSLRAASQDARAGREGGAPGCISVSTWRRPFPPSGCFLVQARPAGHPTLLSQPLPQDKSAEVGGVEHSREGPHTGSVSARSEGLWDWALARHSLSHGPCAADPVGALLETPSPGKALSLSSCEKGCQRLISDHPLH